MPADTPLPGWPDSSSHTNSADTLPAGRSPARRTALTASTMAQIPAFWSATPRPQISPSITWAPNGSARSVPFQCWDQSCVATVSRWPASSRDRPSEPPTEPHTLGLPGSNAAEPVSSKAPAAFMASSTHSAKGPSLGVTLGMAVASRTNRTTSSPSTAAAARSGAVAEAGVGEALSGAGLTAAPRGIP